MSGLKVDPELRSRPERPGEEPRRLGADAALPAHDLVDALERDTDVGREIDLRDPEWLEELLQQNLARMGRDAALGMHERSVV
jgi:hypothetical protein